MSKLTMEETGDLAPDSRAAVISELLNFMATKMEPVPYGTLLYHIMHHFDCREELVSAHVMHGVHILIGTGLLTTNTYSAAPHEAVFMVKQNTVVSPSRKLTAYTFREFAE